MATDKTKDIELNGRRYQLSKMTPLVASRIHGWIKFVAARFAQQQLAEMSHNQSSSTDSASGEPLSDPQQFADGMIGMLWIAASSFLSEETIIKIQNYCLKSCSQFLPDLEAPVPVLMADGRMAAAELENDAVAVSALILQSLQFNISPFFIEGARKGLLSQKTAAA